MTDYKPGDAVMVHGTIVDLSHPEQALVEFFSKTDQWQGWVLRDRLVQGVVLDPEDRTQVGRLLSKLQGMSFAAHACGAFTCLQAGLREFLKPPRISEPGLFAVVEGWQRGEHPNTDLSAFYLREAMDGEEDWTRTSDGKRFEWDDIALPILVREGVA